MTSWSLPGPLDGISLADLQSQLTAAQTAYLQLMSGRRVVTLSYTQGSGSKSVTYQQSSAPNVLALIMSLQSAIAKAQGQSTRVRAPMRAFF